MTEKQVTNAPTDNEQQMELPREVGAASLPPQRRRLGLVMAFIGLFGLAGAMVATVSSEAMRPFAAPSVIAFFFLWKVGKTILRGNIDKL